MEGLDPHIPGLLGTNTRVQWRLEGPWWEVIVKEELGMVKF